LHYAILKQIAKRLEAYCYIKFIGRVDDTTIVMEFEDQARYFFDLKRGSANVYKKSEITKRKTYQAPFDMALRKRFLKGKIKGVFIPEGVKVIAFEVEVKSSYARLNSTLFLEFAGRGANAVITDEVLNIIDALRHTSSVSEGREIGVGIPYTPLEPRSFANQVVDIGDIDSYLEELYRQKEDKKLAEVQNRAASKVGKEIEKFQKLLEGLDDEQSLLEKSEAAYAKANLLLSNLHQIQPYQSTITLSDFEGNEVTIDLPQDTAMGKMPTYYFNIAKKAKQKAENIHIERDNLLSKLEFAKRLKASVLHSTSACEIELLVPKKMVSKRDKKSAYLYEVFKMEDFLIYVGKSEKGNTALLKNANGSDIWMHIQDYPSTHVIIKTAKSTIPESVLIFGGKLCVNFSSVKPGGYLVDYTKRKFVKTIEGSFVSYTHQQSLKIFKS
jgi:predicted ribosome quality control (RQC) complex YloA/Tae2 family protein